jgi:hypothetical protein
MPSTLTRVSTLLTSVGRAEEPRLDGERGLGARLAAEALEGREQRGLLAADVRAGAAPQLDVEACAPAHDVVAEQAARARRLDRLG